jgi:hypothetical protein
MISDEKIVPQEYGATKKEKDSYLTRMGLITAPTLEKVDSSYPLTEKTNNPAAEGRIKFRIVQPKLFHEAVMSRPGEKGKKVRRYFSCVNELMCVYDLYQQVHQKIESSRVRVGLEKSIDDMKHMLVEAKDDRDALSSQLHEAKEDCDEAREQVDKLADDVGQLNINVGTLTNQTVALNTRLGAAAPDHVHPPPHANLVKRFVLMCDDEQDRYTAIRVQARNVNTAIETARRRGYKREVLRIPYSPDGINFWQHVRNTFQGATFRGTRCVLTGATEAQLVAAINTAEHTRRTI